MLFSIKFIFTGILLSIFASTAMAANSSPFPSNLSATYDVSNSRIDLTWGQGFHPVGIFYKFEESINGASWSSQGLPTLLGTSRSATLTGRSEDSYQYRLSACAIELGNPVALCSAWTESNTVLRTVNTAPTITLIGNQTVNEDTSTTEN